MTVSARLVLTDCEGALQDLYESGSGAVWRRRWVTALALLRAIGHVLIKVDGGRDGNLRVILDEAYRELKNSKPEPLIYWKFIEDERNLVLKEYDFRVSPLQIGFGCSFSTTNSATGRTISVTMEHSDAIYTHFLVAGPYAGRNSAEVVDEAIFWWKQYLGGIDARFRSSSLRDESIQ